MLIWSFIFLTCFTVLSYQRASLNVWLLSVGLFLTLMSFLSHFSVISLTAAWLLLGLIFLPLTMTSWRQKFFSTRLLNYYRQVMPSMSRTEREALAAGTVTWEGDLFRGAPDWNKLLNIPPATLSNEEKAFLEGPVETLCSMIDDWDITHNRADLPPEMWQYIKKQGFFGLIIPKQYGGKEFSAYAHSQILTKLYGRSTTVATTIAVPNSLGPAELLLHYGTVEQKNYYLPRLARGEEIPCFALTAPDAGSDAGAMTDKGIVCWGEFEGKKTLGIRLNFNKRYITLAPIASLVGLAFKLYDPDHLIGQRENLGITCALIPRMTPGIAIGRRHFPVNIVFQNGPIIGKDVFIPMDWIIGGVKMAGCGWKMLMECLAAGRAISLPATAIGGGKVAAFTSGAYARVRKQFGVPIGSFEGVEQSLANIGAKTYLMDAVRTFTVSLIDTGEKPAVASAITKYHVTELGRMVSNDAMDLHGGKGICLGPKNYLARWHQSSPIAITVEGANILTRNMIIFGQGAMRCHPYLLAEFEAANQKEGQESLRQFDKAIFGHMSFTFSNVVRSLLLAFTSGRIVAAPSGKTKRYFQQASRFSAAFALSADIALLTLGGNLKRKENISARLGDILSYLYQLSAVLKHYHDQDQPAEDLPFVQWTSQYCLYQMQQSFDELFQNFPNRFIAHALKILVFPFGKHFSKPSDKLNHKVAQLLLSPTGARARLAYGAYLTPIKDNVVAVAEDALHKTIAAEPIEKMLKSAFKDGLIEGDTVSQQAASAFARQLIQAEQLELIEQAEAARQKLIAVDDFSATELAHVHLRKTEDVYATYEATD